MKQARTNIKTYSELQKLETFEERFRYCSMPGQVGEDTFGFDRYLNQEYYKSPEWERIRNKVILRDNGCDLGVTGKDIPSTIMVHHLNPIGPDDIINQTPYLKDPEYLISTSRNTHTAIHFGNESNLTKNQVTIRTKDDQCPWKKSKK